MTKSSNYVVRFLGHYVQMNVIFLKRLRFLSGSKLYFYDTAL